MKKINKKILDLTLKERKLWLNLWSYVSKNMKKKTDVKSLEKEINTNIEGLTAKMRLIRKKMVRYNKEVLHKN